MEERLKFLRGEIEEGDITRREGDKHVDPKVLEEHRRLSCWWNF